MFEVIVQPKECLHDCVLRNRWHIAGAQIFHMGHAGKNGVSLVLLPSETCPALAADKSAAQRGGIHCMLNMLFASLPKQMLDSIVVPVAGIAGIAVKLKQCRTGLGNVLGD